MYAIPDAAWLMQTYLRGFAEVTDLVAQRIYCAFPRQIPHGESFVLIQRIGGSPPLHKPLVVDLAVLQIDVYGGRAADAHKAVAAIRFALSIWQGEQPDNSGNVCGVEFGPLRYQPDETWKPPRPRYIADVSVTLKPSGAVLAGTPT